MVIYMFDNLKQLIDNLLVIYIHLQFVFDEMIQNRKWFFHDQIDFYSNGFFCFCFSNCRNNINIFLVHIYIFSTKKRAIILYNAYTTIIMYSKISLKKSLYLCTLIFSLDKIRQVGLLLKSKAFWNDGFSKITQEGDCL